MNLESTDSIFDKLKQIRPDMVVHTAGLTSVEECEADPHLARTANVDLAANVATVCSRLGIPIIHISTDHLFSGKEPHAEESDVANPQNVYAQTKLEAERKVLEACPDSLVVRTNFYGWGPTYRPSFSDFIINALRSKKRIGLFRDVHYTPILIEVMVQAVHELMELGLRGIVNVVGDERLSKYQFGCKVAQVFELDSSLIDAVDIASQARLVQRPLDLSLSNQMARSRLGRELGNVDRQVRRLLEQEKLGYEREIRAL